MHYMGLAGIEEDQKPTCLSQLALESIKLPLMDKPSWMVECEQKLLGADPPTVGSQVTRPNSSVVLSLSIWDRLSCRFYTLSTPLGITSIKGSEFLLKKVVTL